MARFDIQSTTRARPFSRNEVYTLKRNTCPVCVKDMQISLTRRIYFPVSSSCLFETLRARRNDKKYHNARTHVKRKRGIGIKHVSLLGSEDDAQRCRRRRGKKHVVVVFQNSRWRCAKTNSNWKTRDRNARRRRRDDDAKRANEFGVRQSIIFR